MLVCPLCGFRNTDQQTRCFKCNALLKEDKAEFDRVIKTVRRDHQAEFGDAYYAFITRIVEKNFLRKYWEVPEGVPYRFPFTAGGLSFILPGLGQVYNHQFGKGLFIGLAFVLCTTICIVTLRSPMSNVLLIGLLLSWLAIWSDAVSTAVRINGGTWSFRNSMALWCGVIFVTGLFMTLLQVYGQGFIGFIRITNVTNEVYRPGDVIWINRMAYWFSNPKVGDFIYFDPPKFGASMPSAKDDYIINIQNYFQFVSAVGGDTIRREGSRWILNGITLPKQFAPADGYQVPEWEFRIPEGKYFAPVTRIPPDTVASWIGARPPELFQSGYTFPKWPESTMIEKKDIYGRAVAIVYPPERRRFF